MARTNAKPRRVQIAPLFGTIPTQSLTQAVTHEGGPAITFPPEDQLRRAVLASLLWEDNFYESGASIGARIEKLVNEVDPELTKVLALAARHVFNLRHVPLYLAVCLLAQPAARRPSGLADMIDDICLRADEPGELLAMYWRNGKRPLAKQLKLGLAQAVTKFDGYQLAKWGQSERSSIKLRDVIFLTHAKPNLDSQAKLWKQLCDGTLPPPDTWEVALSAGKDRKETFTRLLTEGRLGYMALLRNLRTMHEVGVDEKLVGDALARGALQSRALPFRFIAAARACPRWEPMIDAAMQIAVQGLPKLAGVTDLLVDVSGSMDGRLSDKSDLRRVDAACGLAILLAGVCETARIWSFSDGVVAVAPRKGMALRDAILHSQHHSGTQLGRALQQVAASSVVPTRTIVITDEQSHDRVGAPRGKGYMLDVAGHQNGVGYGAWTWITGFSEAVVNYIAAIEGETEMLRLKN